MASVLRNSLSIIGAQGITSLVRGIYVVVLAVILGPELYGLYVYGMSWYLLFLPASFLGFDLILGRQIGMSKDQSSAILRRTLIVRLIASTSVAIFCLSLAWFLDQDENMRVIITWFSIALIGRAVAMWSESAFSAFEAAHYTLRQAALFRTSEALAGVFVVAPVFGLKGVVILHAASWILQAIWGVRTVWKKFGDPSEGGSTVDYKPLLREGVPLGFIALLSGWVTQGPVVLLRHQEVGDAVVGQFALALQAFIILAIVPMAINRSLVPVVSRSMGRDDGREASIADFSLRMGILFWGAAGLLAFATGPLLVAVVLGENYALSGDLLGACILLVLPVWIGSVCGRVLALRKLVAQQAAGMIAGTIVLYCLLPLLADYNGVWGATIAIHIAYAVIAAVSVFWAVRQVKINLSHSLFRPLLATAVAFAVHALLKEHTMAVNLTISMATFAAAATLLRVISVEEIRRYSVTRLH